MNTNWKSYLQNKGIKFLNGMIQSYPHTEFNKPGDNTHIDAKICILEDTGIISAIGVDSQKLLHGQLTCDANQVATNSHTLAAACNPKGRVYANFRLLCETSDSWLMSSHTSTLDKTLHHLNKYSIFYKTSLSIKTDMLIFGLMGKNVIQALSQCVGQENIPMSDCGVKIKTAYLIKIHDALCDRFELWIHQDYFDLWWEKLLKHFTPTLLNNWKVQNILSVIPWITDEYAEKYIPQDLNLTSLGFVSFRKGCYTGQEIIARVQNLGSPKTRTYALTMDTKSSPEETKLIDDNNKTIGYLIQYEKFDTKYIALANIRIDAVEKGKIFLQHHMNIPITVHPLPYPFDLKTES